SRSRGLFLFRLLGRCWRRRVEYASYAMALDLFDEEQAALVLDRLAGTEYASGFGEQESGHRRVARLFRQLQIEVAVGVAHREHPVEQVRAVLLLDYLLA